MNIDKLHKWLDDFDNLNETGHFDNQKIEHYVHHYKGMDMKEFLSVGREIIRLSLMYKKRINNEKL